VTFVWGGVLAAGILLVVSPWVWPRRAETSAIGPRLESGRLRELIDAAGMPRVRSRTVIAIALLIGALVAATAWLSVGVPALVVVAGIAGAASPVGWLRARRARLRRTRRGLWPDVCDLLIASVRAGMSLPDAVSGLQVSAPPPLRPAFAAFAGDVAASGHFDTSMQRLKTALSDPIADRIAETLRMARHVGGSELVPILRALAASVRAETALRAEVEARQSWIRGAAVLGVVAPWAILVLLALRPEGARAYASSGGVVLVTAGALVSVVAYRLMLRIGRLPEPRRWFG
jgi:tight adherence protein B